MTFLADASDQGGLANAWFGAGDVVAAFSGWSLPLRLATLYGAGILVGALVNALIYRLAYDRRAIGPWLRPAPQAPARRWSDYIPIVGWFGLARESKIHGRNYWIRPLVIELGTGILLAGLYWWEVHQRMLLMPRLPVEVMVSPGVILALHGTFFMHSLLLALMLVATCIDLDEFTIPDWITVSGTLLALVLLPLMPWATLPDKPWALIRPDQYRWDVQPHKFPDFPTRVVELVENPYQINTLKLSSPTPWPSALTPMPGRSSGLWLGLGCLALWIFALLPRVWKSRRGWMTAVVIMCARIIREPYSWLMGAIGLLAAGWTFAMYDLGTVHWEAMLSSLLGLAVGAILPWWIRVVGLKFLGKEAMGFGDVTLMAMFGAFLGWQPTVMILALAPFPGLVYGLFCAVTKREYHLPFGPFLCLGAAAVILGWAAIWTRVSPLFASDFAIWVIPPGFFVPAVLVVAGGILLPLALLIVVGAKRLFGLEQQAVNDDDPRPPADAAAGGESASTADAAAKTT